MSFDALKPRLLWLHDLITQRRERTGPTMFETLVEKVSSLFVWMVSVDDWLLAYRDPYARYSPWYEERRKAIGAGLPLFFCLVFLILLR